MTIFILMYISLILCWALSYSLPKHTRRNFICITSFLVLWFIQTFRAYDIGVDLVGHYGYIDLFRRANDIKQLKTEIGYLYFNKFIRTFTDNPTIFLGCVSAAFLIPITFIIRKFSTIPILSFIILSSFVLYIFSFSALRQTIAIGITTASYYYIYKRKVIPHYLLLLIAYLVHTSSIIFFIAYPLCNYAKISKAMYTNIFVGFLVSLLFLKSIINWLLPLIFSEGKYAYYISNDTGMAYNLIILIFLFFIFTFFNNKPTQTDLNMQKFVFCSMICQSLGLISPQAPRIGFYFFVYITLALPNTINSFKDYRIRQVSSAVLVIFMIYFFFSKYSNGYLEVIPYSFVWD